MIEESTICPYTGLRPFAEDESIYFKGRDEHIDQATRQLQKNKFIMLTGASGDGKSSLVFAGILPNARAGFLKSQFSNWAVAQFRPERNPLDNLSAALARQLGIANEKTVRTELSHGFSSLVDMYKASRLYTDSTDAGTDEKDKQLKKRHAANLIIVADQFEEFFTNPENFQKGVPSQEANLVTNLLLETGRIALEEGLPIYIIITMRSDFIGQCASFRGLPEMIGFSQFFVPRLNRTQLQEVIEEPASLSGNKISRRLTERLIHDMVEGTDQLPILQHALNQVWKMADEGRTEMDLIHYAMVGGMPGEDLPANDQARFNAWFGALPGKIQACYDQPDLQNVLNTHANKLYAFASESMKEKYRETISESDARIIIETAFKCLTKIDNGRAVRNRMTLGEITAIIDLPHIDSNTVGKVLNVFREPGNTLLRPFFDEAPELTAETVLDITHESLIRNWEKLDIWAKEEFANYTTFLDFSQQLNRWIDSGKSDSFLLYIGPLTYFENFFAKAKPNEAWIARYLGDDARQDLSAETARSILANSNEFLRRSAAKHVVTRTFMKYGAGRIAAAFALLALVVFGGFSIKRYFDRGNSAVLENLKEQSVELLNNQKMRFSSRGALVTQQLRLNLTTIPEAIASVDDPIEKIVIANAIAVNLVTEGRTEPANEIALALAITDSLFEHTPIPFSKSDDVSRWLAAANSSRAILGLAYFYNPTSHLLELQQRNAKRGANCILTVLDKQPPDFTDISGLTLAFETALNFNAWTDQELAKVIAILSPFENKRSDWVSARFGRDQFLVRGYQQYGFNFNGLFQTLACAYAAQGNSVLALRSVDSLIYHSSHYYQKDYTTMLDNATNVVSTFYRGHHEAAMDEFVAGYCLRKKMSRIEFYQRVMGRAKPYQLTRNTHYVDLWEEAENLNLQYGDEKELAFFYTKLREAIAKDPHDDERNLLMAVSLKDQGIMLAYRSELLMKPYDKAKVDPVFAQSVEYFRKVSAAYGNELTDRLMIGGDLVPTPRRSTYIWPDIFTLFHPLAPRDFHWNYMSTSFMEYIIDHNLFNEFYQGRTELQHIEEWLRDYKDMVGAGGVFARQDAPPATLAKLADAIRKSGSAASMDQNILFLFLGLYAYENNQPAEALKWYSNLKPEKFRNLFQEKTLGRYPAETSMRLIAKAFSCLEQNKQTEAAARLVGAFKSPVNRSTLYAFAARESIRKGFEGSLIQQLLDSATAEMNNPNSKNYYEGSRFLVAISTTLYHPSAHSLESARSIIKNQTRKFFALQDIAAALSYRGNSFMATQVIPDNISDEDLLTFIWSVFSGYADSQPLRPEWREFRKNVVYNQSPDRIFYADEGN